MDPCDSRHLSPDVQTSLSDCNDDNSAISAQPASSTPASVDESMDVDNASQDIDDLYLSDSDTDFVDAESETLSTPSMSKTNLAYISGGLIYPGTSTSPSDSSSIVPLSPNDESNDRSKSDCNALDVTAPHPKPSAEECSSGDAGMQHTTQTEYSLEAQTPPAAEIRQEHSLDLMDSIKGLYRILDLISEVGSGGLVDKVIIDQASTGHFINVLRPGAYKDLTKVNFKALDEINVKPLGIYGSKSEIVRFLHEMEVLDDDIARLLMMPHSEDAPADFPSLRAGLYALITQGTSTAERRLFVMFWPEETTWDDNAISSVRRNRITFMRYLTKITDQIMALISEEHCRSLVWDEPDDIKDDMMSFDDLDEDTDRLFTFEVAKANEQEENVTVAEGMKIKSPLIRDVSVPEKIGTLGISEPHLKAHMIAGDTRQALLITEFTPSRETHNNFCETYTNEVQLKTDLQRKDVSLRLSKDISHDAVFILVEFGLAQRYPEPVSAFERRERENEGHIKANRQSRTDKIKGELEATEPKLRDALETYLVRKVLRTHSKLDECILRGRGPANLPSEDIQREGEELLRNLSSIYPEVQKFLADTVSGKHTGNKSERAEVIMAMRKVLVCDHLFRNYELSHEERELVWNLVNSVVEGNDTKAPRKDSSRDETGVFSTIKRGILAFGKSFFTAKGPSGLHDGPIKEAWKAVEHMEPPDFFAKVNDMNDDWPILGSGIRATFKIANEYFAKYIADTLRTAPHKLIHGQIEHCKNELERELGMSLTKAREKSRSQLIADLESAYSSEDNRPCTIILEDLKAERTSRYLSHRSFRATGLKISRSPPSLSHVVHPLELTEEDRQSMKTDHSHNPTPKISGRARFRFSLPLGAEMRLMRLLPKDNCLVVMEDQNRDLYVYLARDSALDAAIYGQRYKKTIKREKTGHDVALTYDEDKRTLVICGIDAQKPLVQVYHFVFDERYETLQAQGGGIDLTQWYTPDVPKILDIHLVGSSDELALLDDTGRLRIFSTVTQQFRPATLQLSSEPLTTFSTPDGSCFGVISSGEDKSTLSVYHWASMGTHEGFSFEIASSFSSPPVISSFDEKSVHLFMVDSNSNTCSSKRIGITRPVTEFQFREKNSKDSSQSKERRTMHNSLLDCHSDVWTRFPVLPAVQRQVIMSSELRKGRSICFVTASDTRVPFKNYFDDMIQKFERSTKKPTGSLLSSIAVWTVDFASATSNLTSEGVFGNCSVYKAGEWVVDIFCLIPIHIAITRDNRFIPLKDGVWAPEVEKSLLGADVGRVADSLSFGWYESIFQSYMSTKYVKVVSSMGEQSVGKSFALNHLADTSFAGSAMRTTEGVWMAVTPTETDLIVALDFEGVHSIERSAQEDTLLVLFNAAISNLVLFRNNFALSRDITNLFQSFQSSSSILDPDANRSLFQSTLVIIIKDVVDSDRLEIAKEFKLKLHRIVQEEQATNFISRLYGGRLNIIPWPVIESRQFYTLFTTLKKHLDSQASTHEGGGAFLHKLKMLMAKLKTNDWGSLSQNMATHRAQHLLSLLPRALSFGAIELQPDIEPLKNFDTNHVIDVGDSDAIFWLHDSDGLPSDKKITLRRLIHRWNESGTRQNRPDNDWIENLSLHLQALVDRRVSHVQAWVDSNLSQFNTNNAAIEELRRALDTNAVELRRSIQLCRNPCERCLLLCVKVQFHEDKHDCSTNHACPHPCQFITEHDGSPDACLLAAGHEGLHICDPMAHLCGHRCDLSERKGCQGRCTKVANHDEAGHLCSARRHLCGEPCELRNVGTPSRKLYTCQGSCSALWDEEHDRHVCDAASCPIACRLCKRLCASPDHLHSLQDGSVHLCGQEHKCTELCGSNGVCEIDTVPQSIEATFSGAHDRFQYTKYTQATKRLQCAVPIPPGLIAHGGLHTHSTSVNPFHYCDARCGNCGYVCTLPQGHPQPEHSTNHGSMSRTRWAVDGPGGSALELAGHKFGSNDDGAPMLCNLVCSSMGRHVHIDYCRAPEPSTCNEPEVNHISAQIEPNPNQAKDWISHKLHWARLGFKDPYSREEQTNFAKCDAMCSGKEHQATATNPAQPSYCTLPIFHQPAVLSQAQAGGHVSDDGHLFSCKNPAVLTQAFHVIFVIDRSGSMSASDRQPLTGTPVSARIARVANNRLGAVYSSLYSFWSARVAAMNQASAQMRRDAYSIVLFNGSPSEILGNDFGSSPDQLLDTVLRYSSGGGTNFSAALSLAEQIMTRHWSTERAPVVIFLSDGECSVGDEVTYSLCRKAVSLGRALSFQAVSFGPDGSSTWLRRMVQIAKEVQDRAPRDPLLPANAAVESSYSIALDSVRLAETFLGIAESLRKTRGGLIR